MGDATAAAAAAANDALELPAPPALEFRLLHQQLRAFASHAMHDDDAQPYVARLERHATALLEPLRWAPPAAAERAALQTNSVRVAGRSVDVPAVIQQELLRLSDECHASEALCFELWYLASDASRRESVERDDQLPAGAIAGSIPAAARHFLVSETEHRLNLLKELLRLRFDDRMDPKRRQFVIAFTNKLMADQLLPKLVAAVDAQLPKLLQIAHMEQSASYWHCLVADALVFIAASCRVTPQEVAQLAALQQTLCARLNASVTKVSPHIVNLSAFAQLFERGSLAGTSPEGAVKQVACMLQAMTTVQVALFNVLLQKSDKVDRDTGDSVGGLVLGGSENAATVRALHGVFFQQEWAHAGMQSVAMLAWAGFLAAADESNSSSSSLSRSAGASVFAEVEQGPSVVKKAIEERVFTTMVDILLKYFPDRKHDPLLYHIFERSFEQLFVTYSTHLMIDVPTLADQAALAAMQSESGGEVAAWTGDCLENLIEFATTLCTRDVVFSASFWRPEDLHHGEPNDTDSVDTDQESSSGGGGHGSCNAFLLACRDAAFKNPACFAAYMRLVAAAASGPDCAQLAFHHVKQNPPILSWEHFFGVMAKYQRLLVDAEKPAGFLPGTPIDSAFESRRSAGSSAPVPRFIRPKELEALEMIQLVIQAVIRDHQLALIFFHNHDWSPIPTFVAFLQCRIPSALKGALMKTLALFARVPEISPFVWRHVDALQILRTTGDTSGYGPQDISYELEHYESMARAYPATRGFVTLLYELFENPHAWGAFEGDGRVAAIQFYFEFLVERVFLKFDLRKYEQEEEKWALVNGALSIFKKILRSAAAGAGAAGGASAREGGLAHQLLARVLSGSPLLEKLLLILSSDGGVESLENASADVHLEHAFFYSLEIVKKKTEAAHGSLHFASDSSSSASISSARRGGSLLTKSSAVGALREQCVQHALEIVVLVLEQDAVFVNADLNRQLSHRLQVERLHTILCRYRADFVTLVQYIKYSKSTRIPHLSAVVLRMISNRMGGADLVDLLLDSGASGDIVVGYMNRLLNVYDDAGDAAANDDDDDDGGSKTSSGDEPDVDNDAGFVTLSSAKKRKRVENSILSPYELLPQELAPPSIRAAILDLLVENLHKPAPNLAHLLLGVLDQRGEYVKAGLDAVLALVASAEFGVEFPELAARCHRVVHLLVAQPFSSSFVVAVLESAAHDFFATQLQLFGSVFHVRRRRDPRAAVAELTMRGWFFKTLAVYLHVALHKEPPQMKPCNRLMSLLLSADERGRRHAQQQTPMLLLQLLDESSFALAPPDVPSHQQVVALAEQATDTVNDGFYSWLKIDVERFCRVLQSFDLSAPNPVEYFAASSSFKRYRASAAADFASLSVDKFLAWAVHWNVYSERVAAESHALNSLRELVEVVVLDYLALPGVQDAATPAMWQGLDAVASLDVRLELMGSIVSAVLGKLTDKTSISAQLFEIVARMALLLFSQLRQPGADVGVAASVETATALPDSRQRQNLAFLELVLRAICSSGHATGNPVAARNARTLLYSCVVNVLHALPSRRADATPPGARNLLNPLGFGTASVDQRVAFLTHEVVDLVCRDASDGDDPLSMALAISALEAVVAFEGAASLVQVFRERGYLLHFIGVFRQLCEMDAALDRGASLDDAVKSRALPSGVDAATIGTMYECFLSLFGKVADSPDGAVALLEGGLVRALGEARNLPARRPKFLLPHDSSSVSRASSVAFQRAESAYFRKWLPVVRLLSALCASLPQNRTLAAQTLAVVSRNRKLFTAALKVDAPHSPRQRQRQQQQPSLNLLREVSYVTFVFRYVAQFVDLCETALPATKWEKVAQLILHTFLFYGAEPLPSAEDDAADDRMVDSASQHVWWAATAPRNAMEQRDDSARHALCADCELKVLDRCDAAHTTTTATTSPAGLLRLSLFDEEKLYASRMILCNAVAFCAQRMMQSVDENAGMLAGKTPLLAVAPRTQQHQLANGHASFASFAPRVTDPLWTHAPSLSDFATRFDLAVGTLDAARQLLAALAAHGDSDNNADDADSARGAAWTLRRRVREHQCDTRHVQSVAEYHADSMGFVVENMVVVLLLHFVHYLAHPAAAAASGVSSSSSKRATAGPVQQVLVKVLTIISDIESNPFVHALARKLRELASDNLP
ncbi:hypothetical protein PybrP1_009978 [[Pythium] brassicae (nom. inval.)]|nr:hypothetical protein PybrP1_009978 [[Pythium] brassicae (nom. inval.)]